MFSESYITQCLAEICLNHPCMTLSTICMYYLKIYLTCTFLCFFVFRFFVETFTITVLRKMHCILQTSTKIRYRRTWKDTLFSQRHGVWNLPHGNIAVKYRDLWIRRRRRTTMCRCHNDNKASISRAKHYNHYRVVHQLIISDIKVFLKLSRNTSPRFYHSSNSYKIKCRRHHIIWCRL